MNKLDSRIYLESRASGPPRILYFHDFKVTDAGTYSCHAYTTYGDIKSEQWGHGSIRIKGEFKSLYQSLYYFSIQSTLQLADTIDD